MPRGGDDPSRGMLTDTEGNDAFKQQILNAYGIMPNAESMILAHKAQMDPAVAHASLMERDEEATAEVRDDLQAVADKLELEDGVVLDASVRGHALVALWQPANGAAVKVVGPYDDKYEGPTLTPQQQMDEADRQRERLLAEETSKLRAQAELRLAEHRREVDTWMAEQMQEIQEQARAAVEEAVAAAQEAVANMPPPPSAGIVSVESMNPILAAPVPEGVPSVGLESPEASEEVENQTKAISETVPAPEPASSDGGEAAPEPEAEAAPAARKRSSKG